VKSIKDMVPGVETLVSMLFAGDHWGNDCFSLIFKEISGLLQVDNIGNYCIFCLPYPNGDCKPQIEI